MKHKNKHKPIILIVDDVPKNIQVLGTLLGDCNCELAVAMNGQQALDTVEKIKPDLILLDVMMPILNGHETCKKLKSNPETADIPVIFLSAKTEVEDIVTGFELGAVDYVTKPFIGRELIARVKTHLELTKAQKVLKEEIASKNKFFSILSHDLRGAFGIIMSLVDIIQTSGDILTQDDINELLIDIANTSTNTLSLLENLLRWARSQTGTIKFTPENLNLDVLFKEVYYGKKDIAQAKGISLNVEQENSTMVFGDSNMIMVILRNLVSNAIKFTPKNGKINISACLNSDAIKVKVADSGVGISAKQMDKLFTIETQTTTSGTNNELGNGLGLILCKEFAKQNGGQIGIESTEGKGTTVWFTIPKAIHS